MERTKTRRRRSSILRSLSHNHKNKQSASGSTVVWKLDTNQEDDENSILLLPPVSPKVQVDGSPSSPLSPWDHGMDDSRVLRRQGANKEAKKWGSSSLGLTPTSVEKGDSLSSSHMLHAKSCDFTDNTDHEDPDENNTSIMQNSAEMDRRHHSFCMPSSTVTVRKHRRRKGRLVNQREEEGPWSTARKYRRRSRVSLGNRLRGRKDVEKEEEGKQGEFDGGRVAVGHVDRNDTTKEKEKEVDLQNEESLPHQDMNLHQNSTLRPDTSPRRTRSATKAHRANKLRSNLESSSPSASAMMRDVMMEETTMDTSTSTADKDMHPDTNDNKSSSNEDNGTPRLRGVLYEPCSSARRKHYRQELDEEHRVGFHLGLKNKEDSSTQSSNGKDNVDNNVDDSRSIRYTNQEEKITEPEKSQGIEVAHAAKLQEDDDGTRKSLNETAELSHNIIQPRLVQDGSYSYFVHPAAEDPSNDKQAKGEASFTPQDNVSTSTKEATPNFPPKPRVLKSLHDKAINAGTTTDQWYLTNVTGSRLLSLEDVVIPAICHEEMACLRKQEKIARKAAAKRFLRKQRDEEAVQGCALDVEGDGGVQHDEQDKENMCCTEDEQKALKENRLKEKMEEFIQQDPNVTILRSCRQSMKRTCLQTSQAVRTSRLNRAEIHVLHLQQEQELFQKQREAAKRQRRLERQRRREHKARVKKARKEKERVERIKNLPKNKEMYREIAVLMTALATMEREEREWRSIQAELDQREAEMKRKKEALIRRARTNKNVGEDEVTGENEKNVSCMDASGDSSPPQPVLSKDILPPKKEEVQQIFQHALQDMTLSTDRIHRTLLDVVHLMEETEGLREELYDKYTKEHQFRGYGGGIEDARGLLKSIMADSW